MELDHPRPNIYLHCSLDPWLILLSIDFQSPIYTEDVEPPKEKDSGLLRDTYVQKHMEWLLDGGETAQKESWAIEKEHTLKVKE